MMDHSNGYLPAVVELLNKIESEQYENIKAAAELMADAVQQDKLINLIRRILKNIAAGSKCSNRRGPLNGRKLC